MATIKNNEIKIFKEETHTKLVVRKSALFGFITWDRVINTCKKSDDLIIYIPNKDIDKIWLQNGNDTARVELVNKK